MIMYAESKAKKAGKIIRNIVIILLCVLVLFVGVVFAVHQFLSYQERKLLEQAGYIHSVSAGEYNLNVQLYGKENGKHTIVGISGMGSSDFAVQIKPYCCD